MITKLTDEQIVKIKDACIEQITFSDSWDTNTALDIGKLLLGEDYLEEVIK